MSSEVKIKIEPGSVDTGVAGSTGVGETTRSANVERRGELDVKQETKVKEEREDGELEIKRALSFSSEETKTEDTNPPKPRRVAAAKESKKASKKKGGSRLATIRANREVTSTADLKNQSSPEVKPGDDVDRVTETASDPYRPSLISPHATEHSAVIIWHAGTLADLVRTSKLLRPFEIQLPEVIWGPVPRPEFEKIPEVDLDLAISFTIHTLLCANFTVKQKDLPVRGDGRPFYYSFSFEEIWTVGMKIYNALSSLVGSTASNFTPTPTKAVSSPAVAELAQRLQDVQIRDPYVTPVRPERDYNEHDVAMESVESRKLARMNSAAGEAMEDRSHARFTRSGRELVTIKSFEEVEREKAKVKKQKNARHDSSSDSDARRPDRRGSRGTKKGSDRKSKVESDPDRGRPKSKKKASKYYTSRHDSGSESSDSSDDEIYLGYDSPDERDRYPTIRAASTIELKRFSGKEMDPDRAKAWLKRLCRKGSYERRTPREMMELFRDHVVRGAKSWSDQLPRSVSKDWSKTVVAFKERYCEEGIKPAETYYAMTRRAEESPLDYLYRLNVAANKAKIRYEKDSKAERAHVDRFLRSVDDEELVRGLSIQGVKYVDHLERTLVDVARNTRRVGHHRDQEAPKVFSTPKPSHETSKQGRDPARDKPTERGVRDRPIPVKSVRFVKQVAAASRPGPGSSDEDPSDGEESDAAGSESQDASSGEERYEARQIAVVQDPQDSNNAYKGSRGRPPCPICGSDRHNESGYWKNLVCTRCNRMGHPSDRCREVCKACDQVHEKGECRFELVANKLAAWYNPTRHAGILPPEVLEALESLN